MSHARFRTIFSSLLFVASLIALTASSLITGLRDAFAATGDLSAPHFLRDIRSASLPLQISGRPLVQFKSTLKLTSTAVENFATVENTEGTCRISTGLGATNLTSAQKNSQHNLISQNALMVVSRYPDQSCRRTFYFTLEDVVSKQILEFKCRHLTLTNCQATPADSLKGIQSALQPYLDLPIDQITAENKIP